MLLCIAEDPTARLRDIAASLDITERSVFGIVDDLTEAGCVVKERDGRRNRHVVQRDRPLPENTNGRRTVGEVIDFFLGGKQAPGSAPSSRKETVGRDA